MMQPVALERSHPAPRGERETGPDSLDAAFAGMLAVMAAPTALPTPAAPAPAPQPRIEAPERRNVRESAATEGREPTRAAERKPRDEEAEARRPDETRAPKEDPAPARAPSTPRTAEETAATGPEGPETPDQPLGRQAGLRAQASETARTAPAQTPSAGETPSSDGPKADGAITPTQARERLEAAAPGLRLQDEGTAPVQAGGKALIDELMAKPKPDLEVPRPLAGQGETPAVAAASETPSAFSGGLPSTALGETPANPAALLAHAPAVREHAQGAAPAKATGGVQAPVGLATSPLSAPGRTVLASAPATAPAASPHPAMAQVEGSIRWMLKTKDAGAELQLHPESLGRLTIQLRVENGDVHARVWATEAATLPILQDHRAFLEVSLREQGLNLGSFDLQQGGRGQETPERAPQGPAASSRDGRDEGRQDSPTLLLPPAASARRIEVFV